MPKGVYIHKSHQGFQKNHPPTYMKFREEHCGWKGDKVGYWGIHKWINRKFGMPMKCENCGIEKTSPWAIHWANLSHQYKRDRSDWKRLCQSCHRLYDNGKIEFTM